MGQYFKFMCDKCEYTNSVSGGPDRGFIYATNTFVCKDCKDIFDAVTETFTDKSNDNKEFSNICPTCKNNNIEIWEPKNCPKCGTPMQIDESITMLWD